jgi:hypothetical protein
MTNAPPVRGTCHGFQILSRLAHTTLTAGGGWPIKVKEIPTRHRASGELILSFDERQGRLPMSIHSSGPGRHEVATTSLGIFEVDALGSTIGVPTTSDQIRREMLTLGTPLALLIDYHGDLALHAAGLVPDSKAILLTGQGGAGKSTLTAAALARGWRILGDDLVRVAVDATISAFQGPTIARVREPAMGLLQLGQVSEVARAAGKILLEPKPFPAYESNQVEVGAIVIIAGGSANLGLTPMEPDAAIPELWKQSFYLPTDSSREACFISLAAMVASVPVMRLAYPHAPDTLDRALELLAGAIETHA